MTMALSHARRHRHPSVPVMVTVVVVVFGALAMLSVLAERNSGAGSSTDGRAAAAKALLAYEDAIYRCNTRWAPWHIVPANKKWYRNLIVSEHIVAALEEMRLKYPAPRRRPGRN